MTRDSQSDTLRRLQQRATVNSVVLNEDTGAIRFLHGRLSQESREEPTHIVDGFLQDYGDLFGISSRREYDILLVKEDSVSNRHVRVERTLLGLRVYPSHLSFWIDSTGVIRRIKAHWSALAEIRPQQPRIDLSQALDAVSSSSQRRPSSSSKGVSRARPVVAQSSSVRSSPRTGSRPCGTRSLAQNSK